MFTLAQLLIIHLCILLSGAVEAVILKGPVDTRVTEDTWALFNCTASCQYAHEIFWNVGDNTLKYVNHRTFRINHFTQETGIDVHVHNVDGECSSSNDSIMQILEVKAGLDLNRTVVQCGARRLTSAGCDIAEFRSNYAFLFVEPSDPETDNPQEPSTTLLQPPSPSLSSSSSSLPPAPQPTATVIKTVTVTSTQLETVTQTVTITPTNLPCDPLLPQPTSGSLALWHCLTHPLFSLLLFAVGALLIFH